MEKLVEKLMSMEEKIDSCYFAPGMPGFDIAKSSANQTGYFS